MPSRQSVALDSIQEALDQGRVDDAIDQLARSAATGDDVTVLAFLCSQRGDYDRAIELLRMERWSGSLGAAGLRLRGNALWRAGRLKEALQDLDTAVHATDDPDAAEAIRSDIVVLRDEVRLVIRVDESLGRLDWGFAAVVGLILAALIEVHRRLLFTRRAARP
jgi:tetratricopeptide (TPR) repeat protein